MTVPESILDNAYAVVIGIADYQSVRSLPATVRQDASDIAQFLSDPGQGGYRSENVQILHDGQATKSGILNAIQNMVQRSNPDSTNLIYVSSHGGQISEGAHAGEYLIPYDTVYQSAQSLAETAISNAELTALLRQTPARRLVVIFDCCHSGGIGDLKDAASPTVKSGLSEQTYNLLKAGRGRVIMASSRDSEVSYVLPNAANSLFTQHLLSGLRGEAPGPGGVIRIFDLFNYLQPLVTQDQPAQHPIFKCEIEDNFPISLYPVSKTPTKIPEASSPLTLNDGYKYDLFISYRRQDPVGTWVKKKFLPALESHGLKALIDYRDFRLGAAIVEEMERGVIESRYTVAVLSPAYFESNFTDFENILAEHLGLEKTQQRLLTVMRETCEPRLRMRARLWLDMRDDDEFDAAIERLVYTLRQPPQR